MGLLSPREIHRLDLAEWRRVAGDISKAGVGRAAVVAPPAAAAPGSTWFRTMLRDVNEALDASPVPASEWPTVQRALGDDLLARLLQIFPADLGSYRSGAWTTPDLVAVRLHALALMVGDLTGTYNGAGVRRWFVRPRTVLDNRAPVDVLIPGWGPDDPGPRQVRSLASALAASPAT